MRFPSTRFIRLVFILSLAAAWNIQSGNALALDAADVYLTGYMQVREAEDYVKQKDYEKAYRKYADAAKIFTTIAQRWPDYEVSLVDFRRKKINEAISDIERMPGFSSVKGYPPRRSSSNLNSRPVGPPPGAGGNSDLMKQMLAQKDKELEDLRSESSRQGRLIAQKDRELMQANGERDSARAKITTLQKQFAQAQAELTKAHNAESGEVAKWKDEVARLQNEVAMANKQSEESAKLAEGLRQELDKASNYEMSRKSDRKELEKERDRLKKLLVSSENEQIKSLVAENGRLRGQLDEARMEVGKLREENSDNKALIASLRSKITTVEAELAKLQEENADYRKQVADLTQQLKDTDAQLDAMAESKGGANPILVKENQVLRNIIGKQLKSQARRKQAKQRVVAEMAKLEIGSKEVLDMIDRLGDDAPLTQEEIETFQRSSGFNPSLIAGGSDGGKVPEYPEVDHNDGPQTKLGLNQDLTQFAKAAAYDFFQGNFNRCEKSYEQILEIVPDNIHSLRNLGIVKIRLKKFEDAKQMLEKALAYNPDDHYSHYVLGVLHYNLSEPDSAIQAMEASLRLNPDNPRAHFYIAVICMEQHDATRGRRDPQRAIAELKQVLRLDPKYGDAHFNLAILYIESPQPRLLEAREHYRQAQRNGSQGTPEMTRMLGT